MDTMFRAFLLSWNWRKDVLTVLMVLGIAYLFGWWRVHRRSRHAASPGRLVLYLTGLAAIGLVLLFWWPILNPAPYVHGHILYAFRIGYLVAAIGANTLLAALLALTERVLYPYYTSMPRLWGLTALEDQALGAAIMWIFGGMMYVVVVLILVAKLLESEAQEMSLPGVTAPEQAESPVLGQEKKKEQRGNILPASRNPMETVEQ